MPEPAEYQPSDDFVSAFLKRSFANVAPAVTGALAALPVLGYYGLIPPFLLTPWAVLATLPILVISGLLGMYLGRRIIRERWGSLRLRVSDRQVISELAGQEPRVIDLADIRKVIEYPGSVLRIESADTAIVVPPGLERYRSLRDRLAAHSPIRLDSSYWSNATARFGLGFGIVLLLGLHFGAAHPSVVITTGLVMILGCLALMVQSLKDKSLTKADRAALASIALMLWPVLKRILWAVEQLGS